MPLLPYPIMVVSYTEETRNALTSTLCDHNVEAVPCSTFCEAEELALAGLYSGLLVDLPSIIKSKGEEKIVAYTLANFFPTLRVRAMGALLVPISMPGVAKQDKSLKDFLNVTCTGFTPRSLRKHKRHHVCLSVLFRCNGVEQRSFTLDLSWGGAFIVDMCPERFQYGNEIVLTVVELGLDVRCITRSIKTWGGRYASGIGIEIIELDEQLEAALTSILKTRKEFDRDRLVA
jgi:PilZ domain